MELLTMSNALAKRLDSIKTHAGIKAREIAQLLDTTPETVSRWRRGKVDPQPDRLKRLLTLEWVMDQLAEFYAPDEARLWLFSRHRLLGGKTPAECLREGEFDEVMAIIDQLRDGAYA
jgi:transcriptional regulator with XRE-family HTH domain